MKHPTDTGNSVIHTHTCGRQVWMGVFERLFGLLVKWLGGLSMRCVELLSRFGIFVVCVGWVVGWVRWCYELGCSILGGGMDWVVR